MFNWLTRFKWEDDRWWWELNRMDEFGLPASWNFVLPDKLVHFLSCFLLTWLLSKWFQSHWAALIVWVLAVVAWDLLWDGCFRYGASWKDILADTLGCLVCLWWLGNRTVGQAW